MGSIYARGNKLYAQYTDATGKRRQRATGLAVGQEEIAKKALATIEEQVEAHRRFVAEGKTPKRTSGPLTVGDYAERWTYDRKARGVGSAVDEERRLQKHALPVLGDLALASVRPRHIRDLVRQLKERCGQEKEDLAPRTVRHVYAGLRTMFHEAVVDELIQANPCVLKKGELPKKIDKDPAWRRSAMFTRQEVLMLLGDERVPEDRRVVYGLLFLAGLRFGESAALRWKSYDEQMEPLPRLSVVASYCVKTHQEKSVKTERPREVPVHPALRAVLERWRSRGWREMLGREPTIGDLVIPSREGKHRNVNLALKRFKQDCERLGLRPRRQHDLRRTFITLCRADGARKDILHWISHGPEGDIVDLYTTLPWASLCDEILKLRITIPNVVAAEGSGVTMTPATHSALDVEPIAALSVEAAPGEIGLVDGAPRTLDVALSDEGDGRGRPETAKGLLQPLLQLCKPLEPFEKGGGVDGTRTRGLRRDRPAL